MHIYNTSVTYLQSIEKILWKLWEELISQNMHSQPLFTSCSRWKNGSVKNPVSLSKIFFSASSFFMHIFNISVTHLQSAEKIQWKL